jgi:hypothetical protein
MREAMRRQMLLGPDSHTSCDVPGFEVPGNPDTQRLSFEEMRERADCTGDQEQSMTVLGGMKEVRPARVLSERHPTWTISTCWYRSSLHEEASPEKAVRVPEEMLLAVRSKQVAGAAAECHRAHSSDAYLVPGFADVGAEAVK